MNFALSADRQAFRERVQAWCADHRSTIREHADISKFPRDVYADGMANDIGNVIIPPEYGGPGGGAMEYALVAQETGLFQICFQLQRALLATGTDAQKETWLPQFANGDAIGAIAISEPDTGSSLKSMETTAERDGDEFVLNGVKSHVNLAAEADIQKVYAMTDAGLTAFLVSGSNPGLHITEKGDPIGTRYLPIYDMELRDCRIPADNVLLEPGDGYEVFFKTFNFSRIGNASEMLGEATRALDDAVAWAQDRAVGENTVTDFQGIRWKIAEHYTALRSAELLRNEAAWRIDTGKDASRHTSMAKLAAANAAVAATTDAMQITGAHGLYRDQPYEEYFRNVKTLEIAGGSREIMKNIIADAVIEEGIIDITPPTPGADTDTDTS